MKVEWERFFLKYRSIDFSISSRLIFLGAVLILFVVYYLILPDPLFDTCYSSAVYSRSHTLLSAQVACDDQWRLPINEDINPKLEKCILAFEDEYFYYHLGVNPISIFKALLTNFTHHRIKRGGSTITMQVIRLSRLNPSRTIPEKLYEMLLATRLEAFSTKAHILKLYASYAPFGGNIVGVETASWRYFGRSSSDLSWAECATLAVLPNAPSLIFPGKNQNKLLEKRNRLLHKLYQKGIIDHTELYLALQEALPTRMFAIPRFAPHLLQSLSIQSPGQQWQSTINESYQKKVLEIVDRHHQQLKLNHIFNASALVADTKTGEILAYVGNVNDTVDGWQIDMINRPRSSGSTLKPFLYEAMLRHGWLNSQMMLQDIPMDIDGYEPKNNNKQYDGWVPAQEALVRSLNVPWILALKSYGYEKFYNLLRSLGFEHFDHSAKHYGLSLVVGGGEVTMLQLANAYRSFSAAMYDQPNQALKLLPDKSSTEIPNSMNKGSAWLTLQALTQVVRPENESGWFYRQTQKLAWKTGTSHGFKDAWAIGLNPSYTIVVWAGNADGTGRPELTGVRVAAPIMFDIINSLPPKASKWWPKPENQLKSIDVCKHSGALRSSLCPDSKPVFIPHNANFNTKCVYHQNMWLDSSLQYRVNASCYSSALMKQKTFLDLPPLVAYYYQIHNPLIQLPPPYMPGCTPIDNQDMYLVYPTDRIKIAIPQKDAPTIIFKAHHRIKNQKIYWYLDQKLIGTTTDEHKIEVALSPGVHKLSIQDASGKIINRQFEVID